MKFKTVLCGLSLLVSQYAMMQCAVAQAPTAAHVEDEGNMKRFPPFRIAGNLYYVGSWNQSSYLLTTPQGIILVNSGMEPSAAQLKESIKELGFKLSDVKILLLSHAHMDNDAGAATIIKETGAKYEVMEGDIKTVESGGGLDFGSRPDRMYPPAHVERVLHDDDTVSFGGMVLTAHWTPGHTKGNTTWTFNVEDGGRSLPVVIVGGTDPIGLAKKLRGNVGYPQMAEDFQRTFKVLKSLPCEIFLGAMGEWYNLPSKYAKLLAGDKDAFVDPQGYKAFVAAHEKVFEERLAKETAEAAAQ